jgi:hypothetical protein
MDAGGLPHTMTSERTSERGSRSDAWSTWRNGSVEGPKESVSLDVKRAFPYGIDGRTQPGETAGSTAVPRVC